MLVFLSVFGFPNLVFFGEKVGIIPTNDLFISHQYYLGELIRIGTDQDRQNASFRIVPGLANGDLISFESINFPGYYLCHQGYRIKLIQVANNDQLRKGATFRRVPGLANSSMVSFESLDFPGYYIRHRDYRCNCFS